DAVSTQAGAVLGPERFGIDYQASLDGIRGLSIALVLLFHGGVRWMDGGYVGVSVFFTLSGSQSGLTTVGINDIRKASKVKECTLP
ncbi:MAG: hypothetical protein ACO3HV_06845, partial [Candidatus Nanopelagicales bacterium]